MQNPTKTQKYDTIQEQNINGFRAEITCNNSRDCNIQGVQDHFLSKEMLISLSILKLHKNP